MGMRTRACEPTRQTPSHGAPPPPRARCATSFRELLRAPNRGHSPAHASPCEPREPGRLVDQELLPAPPKPPQPGDQGKDQREEGSSEQADGVWHESPELDPLARTLAADSPAWVPAPDVSRDASARVEAVRATAVEPLLGALVRRAAWGRSPDGRTASLRLEIGEGPFAGATILITADPRDLQIELDAPPEIDLEAWKTRLRHRLASQGLIATIS